MTPDEAKGFYDRINVDIDSTWEYPAFPMDQYLDQFENDFQIKLPSGYRSFINVFGPGFFNVLGPDELDMEFRIFPPYKISRHDVYSIQECAAGLHDELSDHFEDPRSILPFALSEFVDTYLFDSTETTNSTPLEYRIYMLDRRSAPPIQIASSFSEFVFDYCLGRGAFGLYGVENSPNSAELKIYYTPTRLRKK